MVIRGHVELLLNRPGIDANAARNAEAIQKASDRAAGITQQLLAFSRKQVLQARVIEMRTVVKDIANLSRRLLGPMVQFQLELPQEPLWVRADESQLEQVVLILLSTRATRCHKVERSRQSWIASLQTLTSSAAGRACRKWLTFASA